MLYHLSMLASVNPVTLPPTMITLNGPIIGLLSERLKE